MKIVKVRSCNECIQNSQCTIYRSWIRGFSQGNPSSSTLSGCPLEDVPSQDSGTKAQATNKQSTAIAKIADTLESISDDFDEFIEVADMKSALNEICRQLRTL